MTPRRADAIATALHEHANALNTAALREEEMRGASDLTRTVKEKAAAVQHLAREIDLDTLVARKNLAAIG